MIVSCAAQTVHLWIVKKVRKPKRKIKHKIQISNVPNRFSYIYNVIRFYHPVPCYFKITFMH